MQIMIYSICLMLTNSILLTSSARGTYTTLLCVSYWPTLASACVIYHLKIITKFIFVSLCGPFYSAYFDIWWICWVNDFKYVIFSKRLKFWLAQRKLSKLLIYSFSLCASFYSTYFEAMIMLSKWLETVIFSSDNFNLAPADTGL